MVNKNENINFCPDSLLFQICQKLKDGYISDRQVYDEVLVTGLYDYLIDDIEKFRYFTFDGRFEDILIETICNKVFIEGSCFDSYEEYIKVLNVELTKHVVPTLILIPMVFIHGLGDYGKLNKIEFENDNVSIFPMLNKEKKYRNERYSISKYVEKTIYARLLEQHILSTKDKNFFNYPILAIKINDIDSRVEQGAPKIVEAVYSIIRMICFQQGRRKGATYFNGLKPFPMSYAVYYNKVSTSPMPPYDSGYGYSFRFMFADLLDVDAKYLLEKNIVFSRSISKFIDALFLSPKDTLNTNHLQLKKWQNAVLLYNEAYEIASKEHYDSSLLLLMAILESLFLKNEGRQKSERLVEAIKEFFDIKDIDDEMCNVVRILYRKRNEFIHGGIKMKTNHIYKTLHDTGGLIIGLEPLKFSSSLPNEHDLRLLSRLFNLCSEIILRYPNKENINLF